MSCSIRAAIGLVIACAFTTPAAADVTGPPQLMPRDRLADLGAVARMRGERSPRGGCTAVLVTQTLAISSAHCVARAQPRTLIFNATGENRLTVPVELFELHPGYAQTSPPSTAGYINDLALVHLSYPVPPEVAQPLPLGQLEEAGEYGAFGYVNRRGPGVGSIDDLRGNEPCLAVQLADGPIASSCSVANGQSGGALVHLTDEGPVLVGILVAQIVRGSYRSLIAPVVPEAWPALAVSMRE